MAERTASVEYTEDEFTALGVVLAMWRAQSVGTSLQGALLMMAALEDVDQEMLIALIDRVAIKMSIIEDEVLDKASGIFDHESLRDRQSTMIAFLDQKFAEFAEEGRTLFPPT